MFKISRNCNLPVKNHNDLVHGKYQILAFLDTLPCYKHVEETLGGFDIGNKTENTITISYHGEIYEKGKNSENSFYTRAFFRTLILAGKSEYSPDTGLDFTIINDCLVLKAIFPDQNENTKINSEESNQQARNLENHVTVSSLENNEKAPLQLNMGNLLTGKLINEGGMDMSFG